MINTALVSFGMSGKVFHAPFIASNPNFKLVGSWERSSQNIEAAYPGTKSYSSYEEILTDASIDLVVVNSPNDSHYTYTKQALLAGKHVVCEKAFTITAAEAQELDDIAKQKGFVKKGDILINLAAMPVVDKGMVNTLRISEIG